ncbi:hypothetical protein IW261DRAFT_1678268 [Armillaria novae-zelandiae]|uniref:F-box domain-containing protein n=1 Tax=Armillaria novae-zelandiae TaxID=153914 RepID=A0AA39PDU0_9AGAR|nr:hypothetical protein IW261DRAFT_1678268 [Armillaria novae-zelandiae]
MKDAPWIFLRVCHWWRLVASSSPALWSTVKLVKSTDSLLPPHHALHIVRLQLQLSGNLPLKLLLYCNIPGDVVDDAIITELVSRSSRWYQMDIRVYAPVLRQFSSRLGNLSTLKTLTLKGFREWEFRSNTIFDAPNLTSLCLDSSCRLQPSMSPTSNLRQFTGGFYDGAEFRNFISAVPRLEVLGVQTIGSGGRHTQSSNIATRIPVTLHHLHQLSYLSYAETCTSYLTLPALRILNAMQSTGSTRAITALYSRSHFSLDELYLCRFYITFAAAAYPLEMRGILDLTHLHLEVNNFTVHDWIIALTVTTSSCLLPNLSQLTVMAHVLEDSVLVDLDEARHFLDMVHSRLPDRAEVNPSLKTCLKKIDLLIWEPFDARRTYFDAFRAFREGGLDANLHFAEETSHTIDDSFSLWNIGPRLCLGSERLPFR